MEENAYLDQEESINRLQEENRLLRAALETTDSGRAMLRQEEEFSRLLAVSQLIVSELDLPKVFDLVAGNAREIVDAELLIVPMLNEGRDQYTYVAASGDGADQVRGLSFKAYVGMCGWVLQHERSLLFGESGMPWKGIKTAWEAGQQSAVLVPLMGRKGIIGGLSALGKQGGGCFGQHDLDLLTMFANQVSIAIENAQLFQQVTREMEERKQSEAALKQERDFTAAVVDTVASIVVVMDREGMIVRFNRACEEVSGYAAGEVLGRHVWDFLVPPEQTEGVKQVFRSLTAGMFPNRHENYWMAKDGGRRLIAWSNTALLGPDGSVDHVIATGIDVTEHRQAEESLLQEKKFSDGIIDSLPGVFLICDETGRLIRWNDNEKQVTGYSVDEFSKMSMRDIFRDDRSLIEGSLKEVFETGHASCEARINTKSGMLVPVLLTGFRMVLNDSRYFVGIGIDISERKRLEDQLRQSQKMESIGTLAGGISHDFNNILTAIIGYGNLIQMKVKEGDPIRHNVDQILASAYRAAGLIQGLLAYSRKQVLNPQSVDLNEVIRKVERLLVRLIGEDLDLKILLADRDVTVQADVGQIEQVLMNLATNARDAMPEGGYLFIETDALDMDGPTAAAHGLADPGAYALITVTDSGTGMNEKTMQRIFEPFFTTKDAGKGTGLGLAMVYGIIKQHKGCVEVESEEGQGTTFRIYLPIIPVERKEELPKPPSVIAGGTEVILVAEDDETVRGLTCSMLEQFGYGVIQAVNGEDAVNKFMENKDKVRLLLLDVLMPKKNGREVYEKIRIFAPGIKVLFLSGYTADVIHEKGLLDRECGVILKPVPMNELLRKVRSLLDS